MNDATPPNLTREQLAGRLKSIADPVRLAILHRLPPNADHCEQLYNVSELAEEIGVSQPTISHHLRHLRQAGLVHSRKMCRDVYYWVNHAAVTELLNEFSATLRP
ncbi:MAG: metalloregulator ArsR/SmtB family transcription factor [Phycisphaeraceae bacterium]